MRQGKGMMKLVWIAVFLGLIFSKWAEGFVTNSESNYELSGATDASMVPLTLIQGAKEKGAVCLDGTLPAYHLQPGSGPGASSWLIHMEGGGWCENITSCVARKKTPRGSSTFMEKQIQFTGILSNNAAENPDFYNWNRVFLRHCDGGSFTGDTENKEASLQFRGKNIWNAAMEDLKSKGMGLANQALLSGCSAGGLASMFYCDVFHSLFPVTTRVKCLSDAGFFADVPDVAGARTFRKLLDNVVGVRDLKTSLPPPCAMNHLDPTSNFIATIKTPLFLLNTAYDIYMIIVNLAPPSADPGNTWHDCELDRTKCSASQIQFLQGFRNQTLNAMQGFAVQAKSGLFVNSCFAHCQSETQNTWFAKDSPVIGTKAIAQAVGDWYFDRAPTKLVDCPYPCGKFCHNYPFLEALNAVN